jgi:hypothetical protein
MLEEKAREKNNNKNKVTNKRSDNLPGAAILE